MREKWDPVSFSSKPLHKRCAGVSLTLDQVPAAKTKIPSAKRPEPRWVGPMRWHRHASPSARRRTTTWRDVTRTTEKDFGGEPSETEPWIDPSKQPFTQRLFFYWTGEWKWTTPLWKCWTPSSFDQPPCLQSLFKHLWKKEPARRFDSDAAGVSLCTSFSFRHHYSPNGRGRLFVFLLVFVGFLFFFLEGDQASLHGCIFTAVALKCNLLRSCENTFTFVQNVAIQSE